MAVSAAPPVLPNSKNYRCKTGEVLAPKGMLALQGVWSQDFDDLDSHEPSLLADLAGNAMTVPVVMAVFTAASAVHPALLSGHGGAEAKAPRAAKRGPPSVDALAPNASSSQAGPAKRGPAKRGPPSIDTKYTVDWAKQLKLHEASTLTSHGADRMGCQACGLTESRKNKWKLTEKFVCVGGHVFESVDAAKRRRLLYHIGVARGALQKGQVMEAQGALKKWQESLQENRAMAAMKVVKGVKTAKVMRKPAQAMTPTSCG